MPNNDAIIKTVGSNIQEIYSKLIEKKFIKIAIFTVYSGKN